MYEDIKQQFKAVIEYSQCIPDPKVDNLFERWERSKKKFLDLFGGPIFEWPEPIEFTLDDKEKRSRVMEFADRVHDSFNNSELAHFIDENVESFFENTVSKSSHKDIPEGMKLVKAFKYFEDNKAILNNMQSLASQLIQENKIKGTLCFSVHPLDFLSSSLNTYNWRSCHALDGEYRAGNLSYMVDETTFMVYLKGADNVNIPLFPENVKWNSKKWRMLIHSSVNNEIIFAGRQYPFSSKSGIDTVLNIYNNIINKNNFWWNKYSKWRADYVNSYVPFDAPNDAEATSLSSRYLIINNKLIDIEHIVKEGHWALNYNDILRSSCYLFPYYAILNSTGERDIEHLMENPIIIGEEVACLHCGNEIITDAGTMRCDDCEMKYGYEENDSYGTCACCGSRIYLDDATAVGNRAELICDYCFDNECFVCDCCGDVFFNEDRCYIDEEGIEVFCPHCYEDYLDKKENY